MVGCFEKVMELWSDGVMEKSVIVNTSLHHFIT